MSGRKQALKTVWFVSGNHWKSWSTGQLTCKIYVGLPFNAINTHRCDLNDQESENPVGCTRERCRRSSDGQRCVLGRHYECQSCEKDLDWRTYEAKE